MNVFSHFIPPSLSGSSQALFSAIKSWSSSSWQFCWRAKITEMHCVLWPAECFYHFVSQTSSSSVFFYFYCPNLDFQRAQFLHHCNNGKVALKTCSLVHFVLYFREYVNLIWWLPYYPMQIDISCTFHRSIAILRLKCFCG